MPHALERGRSAPESHSDPSLEIETDERHRPADAIARANSHPPSLPAGGGLQASGGQTYLQATFKIGLTPRSPIASEFLKKAPRPIGRGACDKGGIMSRKSGLMSRLWKRGTVEMM